MTVVLFTETLLVPIQKQYQTQHKTRQGKTRQDTTRQDKTRQDKTRQDKTRQDNAIQDKARHRNPREALTAVTLLTGLF